jgi:hypothetical protein
MQRDHTAMQQVLINFDSQENKSHKQEYLFLASFDDVLVLITLIISLKTANAICLELVLLVNKLFKKIVKHLRYEIEDANMFSASD